jgi:hypothetical protein
MTEHIDYGTEHEATPASGQLAQLTDLVDQMAAEEQRVAEIELELQRAKATVRSFAENRIPELMRAVGVETITTSSGLVVGLKTNYRASPKVADRERAWAWLEEHGHGGLLKRNLTVGFGRGEDELAAELLEQLQAKFSNVKEDRGVHPQTLKAWAKEMIESGQDLPMDVFGVEVIESAVVKRPTSKD